MVVLSSNGAGYRFTPTPPAPVLPHHWKSFSGRQANVVLRNIKRTGCLYKQNVSKQTCGYANY